MTWPPEIGSPQWRHQYESIRVHEQFLRNKLSDDRQYLADPMMRADDRAMLQDIENSLAIFKLEEELLTNPSLGRVAEINAQRVTFAATQRDTFAFFRRLGQRQSEGFHRAKQIFEQASSATTAAPINGNGRRPSIAPKRNGSAQHVGEAVAPRRGRDVDPITELRRRLIHQVYKRNRNLKGEAFWTEVQKLGGRPSYQWNNRGCPKTLVDAFRDGKWKKTLTDEKTRETAELRSPSV